MPGITTNARSSQSRNVENFDLVIVGAGIHGIATLKTYREVNPNAPILVLDKGSSLGGVWAKDRLYPGLRTNNHFQTFEFSEYPMSTDGFDLKDDHVPGEHVNDYLHSYATKFDLMKYMRFNSSVTSAVDNGTSGWTLTVVDNASSSDQTRTIKAAKLIIATGLTSEPLMPKLPGKEIFDAPIYHTSELAKAEKGLGPYKKITLLSGAKFSWDIACAYASAGISVDWVIRESGHGPCWMMPNRLTPLQVIPELLLQTRLITWLSPCIFADAAGFGFVFQFFHKHWLGRKIVDGFFAKMQHSAVRTNNYDGHPETAKLKPWDDVFFIGTNRGLLNYGLDFFEFVRNGIIRVHIADITHLSKHTIHLSDGKNIGSDVLICGTGWKDTPPINFVTKRELGLPGHSSQFSSMFIPKADATILESFPKLKDQPPPRKYKPLSGNIQDIVPEPYRHYRFMVPPAFMESRTLAFAGAYRSPATTIISQVQALWITAFFSGDIKALREPTDPNTWNRILYETVLHTQFSKWRYSRGFGARFPELWFDCLPYVDQLLKDVGIENRRKPTWWQERFTPYRPRDYLGIIGEYIEGRDKS